MIDLVKMLSYMYLHYASVESKDLDQHAHMQRLRMHDLLSHQMSGLSSCERMLWKKLTCFKLILTCELLFTKHLILKLSLNHFLAALLSSDK